MKKRYSLFLLPLFIGAHSLNASVVSQSNAQQVAENFYKENSKHPFSVSTHFYTAMATDGNPAYYVFNINQHDGFVIVAAEDNARPIIGYATEGNFIVPPSHTAISKWLKWREREITLIRTNYNHPDASITSEWNKYNASQAQGNTRSTMSSVNPLLTTTWDQSPYYNDSCPGGSVTGCVATAMAQIMKYWSYPAQGVGSSSYCDCTNNNFTNNYGTLSANYGNTSYNWSGMPNSISAPNSNIAQLMYQCGISVNMDYDPAGSGSYVLNYGNANFACAQNSYVNYFKYDPNSIQGLSKSDYNDTDWMNYIKSDLDIGRPVQYVGVDTGAGGGHTWVCDGYDNSDNLHMNWGWGGYDNGYYTITNLNGGGYNFINDQEALIGIQPISTSIDMGIASLIAPSGVTCGTFTPIIRIRNYGVNTLDSCIINYKLDNGTVYTQAWHGSLATTQYADVTLGALTAADGSHTLTCYTTYPNNSTDGNTSNDQGVYIFNVTTTVNNLPVMEGFENATSIPTDWSTTNPDADQDWEVSTTVANTGSHSLEFNNFSGSVSVGTKDLLKTPVYDLSNITQPKLHFDVSYAYYESNGDTYTDSLSVYYSADCGSTWNKIYMKGGADLSTAPSTASQWSPSSASDWRTDSADISSLAGQSHVVFGFENLSGYGNFLYIDNINITGTALTTGINALQANGELLVYPNPASGSFTISGTVSGASVHYDLLDIAGRQVKSGDVSGVSNGSYQQTVFIGDLAAGIYFVKVKDQAGVKPQKIEVQ